MQVGMIGFTRRGTDLVSHLKSMLEAEGFSCMAYAPKTFLGESGLLLSPGASAFAGEMFRLREAMIFVGAAGIATRAIAPFVRDKFTDPPVLVVDEAGQFVIPLLSGHVGGANELARDVARLLGAIPVITTATDVNAVFAVDVFAAKNRLTITSRLAARKVAMELLAGREVGFFAEEGVNAPKCLPNGLVRGMRDWNIRIGIKSEASAPKELVLVPKNVVVGVGCKRGVGLEVVSRRAEETLKENGILQEAVCALASIDIKREEQALIELSEQKNWKFLTYSAETLNALNGTFSSSNFVQHTVGVDCVCERAAIAGAGEGASLLFEKNAGDGVTVAAARMPYDVRFEV